MESSSLAPVPPQITCDLRSLDEESFKKTMEEQVKLGWPDVEEQYKAFVSKYLIDFNYHSAAIAVGIDPKSAIKILRDPLVNAYVKWMRQGLEARDLMTRELVVHKWLETLPELRGDVAVPFVTKMGENVMVRKYHASEYVRALVELSRITNLTPQESLAGKQPKIEVTLNFQGLAAPAQTPIIDAEVVKNETF